MPPPPPSSVVPVDFTRDDAWFTQLQQGDVITDEEMTLLWKDLATCYSVAKTLDAVLAAADMRISRLEAENARLRAELEAFRAIS